MSGKNNPYSQEISHLHMLGCCVFVDASIRENDIIGTAMMSIRICRIKREIAEFTKSDSESEGIYYFPETDSRGYGLIRGCEGTPYEDGFYIIKFDFPEDYPFKPPKCAHIGMSGIRQSPNFHDKKKDAEGLVCLSRLNTWQGSNPGLDRWTPSLSIQYILHMIQKQVLTIKPLDNEPDYEHTLRDPINAQNYEKVVIYHNYRSNVVEIYDNMMKGHHDIPLDISNSIANIVFSYATDNRVKYLQRLNKLKELHNGVYVSCTTYNNSSCFCDYVSLLAAFTKRFGNIRKIEIKLKAPRNRLPGSTSPS